MLKATRVTDLCVSHIQLEMLPRLSGTINETALNVFGGLLVVAYFGMIAYFIRNAVVSFLHHEMLKMLVVICTVAVVQLC